jgi:hypothetical protein
MNRTQGRGDGERHGAGQGERDGQDERRHTAEREASDHASQTGYRPGANQRRHEPMPASRHDDRRQEAVIRNEDRARRRASPALAAGTVPAGGPAWPRIGPGG